MSGKIRRTRYLHTEGSSHAHNGGEKKTAMGNHNDTVRQFNLDKTTTLCWFLYWDISQQPFFWILRTVVT